MTAVGPLLKEFIQNMQRVASTSSEQHYKMYMYSAVSMPCTTLHTDTATSACIKGVCKCLYVYSGVSMPCTTLHTDTATSACFKGVCKHLQPPTDTSREREREREREQCNIHTHLQEHAFMYTDTHTHIKQNPTHIPQKRERESTTHTYTHTHTYMLTHRKRATRALCKLVHHINTCSMTQQWQR